MTCTERVLQEKKPIYEIPIKRVINPVYMGACPLDGEFGPIYGLESD
jgi:hypothetical protein